MTATTAPTSIDVEDIDATNNEASAQFSLTGVALMTGPTGGTGTTGMTGTTGPDESAPIIEPTGCGCGCGSQSAGVEAAFLAAFVVMALRLRRCRTRA